MISLSLSLLNLTQVETYGTSTVVFVPYFALIQAGELRPFTYKVRWINDRLRLDYNYLRSTVSYHWGTACISNIFIPANEKFLEPMISSLHSINLKRIFDRYINARETVLLYAYSQCFSFCFRRKLDARPWKKAKFNWHGKWSIQFFSRDHFVHFCCDLLRV